MSDNWIQIKAECGAEDVGTVESVMSMVGTGLMTEDYSDLDELLSGVYGELVDESLLTADRSHSAVSVFVSASASPAESELFIRERLADAGIDFKLTHTSVSEEDWADSWKQYYKPLRCGKRIMIVPVWEQYEPSPDDIVVLMDPGMAFGTGTHETTRLCAALLEEYTRPDDRMIDVGCGSGILAICASKLGASECLACDIDPDAVRVARENTELNQTPNVHCEVSDLVSEVKPELFDIAAVNIVADVIIRLAPDIGRYLTDDAVLIVSGIICERAEETLAALKSAGFTLVSERRENGWYAAALKKIGG